MTINIHIILIMALTTTLMSIMSFINQTKHVIMMLILLETLALSIYLMISFNIGLLHSNFSSLVLFLTMSVCEASLGLASLVSILRAHGNDYVSTLTMKNF
uniref:NADH-ubiquinone oxidoreductase chain 4L n=1 Tax=Pectinodonta sp. TaxID=3071117 RepID=A0AA96HRK9_9GAST|nr:NADH dehydrogenase subunit 4l [Pectinodonta sp.]